jgi:hypothetical protein
MKPESNAEKLDPKRVWIIDGPENILNFIFHVAILLRKT